MQRQMIISVMAKDRPGIIAAVTGAIYELHGDLADLNQSILRGYLTMILIASFDTAVTVDEVFAKISAADSGNEFDIIVKPMQSALESEAVTLPARTYIVTAQGVNKSGLVYGISSFCYQRHINILDLSTTLTDGRYTMILQIDLSHVESIKDLRDDLDSYAQEAEMHVMMQHYEIFRVTNEVTMK